MQGKYYKKESLVEIYRMIFTVSWSDPTHSNHNLLFGELSDGTMKQKGIGSLDLLKVLVLQWNSHPHLLIYVHSKSKVTQNISNLQDWH